MESFVIHDFGLFLPITFEGKQVYAYIDLGANPGGVVSLLGQRFETIGSKINKTAFGDRQTSLVRIPELSFLGKNFQDVDLTVSHCENFSEIELPVLFHLGAKELLAFPLCLDFHRLTATFKSSGELKDSVTIPLRQKRNLVLFSLNIQGREVQAIFDTGAGVSVLNTAHLDDLGLKMEWLYDIEASDPNGATAKMDMYWLPDLQIQDIVLGATEVAHTDLTAIETALDTRIDLLFGANTMLKTGRTWLLEREKQCISISRK